MLDFSNAFPCAQRASYLRTCLSKKLAESLIHLIEVSEDFLDKANTLGEMCHQPLNQPFLYGINAEWMEAIEREDVEHVRLCADLLQQIVNRPQFPKFITFDDLQFSTSLAHMFIRHSTKTFPEKKSVWVKNAPVDQFSCSVELIHKSLSILMKVDHNLYEEVEHLIKNYIIVDSNRILYGSSFNLFGLIILKAFEKEQTIVDVIDIVVHEAAHHHIFALSVFDPLVLNSPEELFKSPFRKDPRPMMGIYHATFVLARVMYMFSKILKSEKEVQIDPLTIQNKIIDYHLRFKSSLEIIEGHAQLTELGRNLIDSTQEITQTAVASVVKNAA